MATVNVDVDNQTIAINESNQVTFFPTAPVNLQNQRLANLAPAVADTDAVSKIVMTAAIADAISTDSAVLLTGDQAINGVKTFTDPILGTLDGTANTAIIANTISGNLNTVPSPSGNYDFNGQRIINLGRPVDPNDAANNQFVSDVVNDGLNNIASSYVFMDSAFGINGGPSVIEFNEIVMNGNDNSFSIELHIVSYYGDNFAALYNIQAAYNQTNGVWQIIYPNSCNYNRNNSTTLYPQLEIKVTNNTMNLRVRRINFVSGTDYQNLGYRCLVKSGSDTQIFSFIDESSDPEPTEIYQNNVLNTYISNAIDANIGSPVVGQSLKYDGGQWNNNWTAPMVSVYFFSPVNFTSGVRETLVLDGKSYDTTNAYNLTTGIYTAQVSGFYLVDISSKVNSDTTLDNYFVSIYKNSALSLQGTYSNNSAGGAEQISVASGTIKLAVGDTLYASGLANGTGNLSLNFTTLTISFLSNA